MEAPTHHVLCWLAHLARPGQVWQLGSVGKFPEVENVSNCRWCIASATAVFPKCSFQTSNFWKSHLPAEGLIIRTFLIECFGVGVLQNHRKIEAYKSPHGLNSLHRPSLKPTYFREVQYALEVARPRERSVFDFLPKRGFEV